MRSSIWFRVARTSTSGSTNPVGRTSCSTTWLEADSSHSPGVADTKTTCGTLAMNSSNRRGRLSRAEGSRNPLSMSDELPTAIAVIHAVELGDGVV